MTVIYRRPAARGDWGAIVVGGRAVPLRVAAVVGGAVWWLLLTLVATGAEVLVAIWTNLLFLLPLLLIGTVTRGVSLARLLQVFFIGGALMGLVYLLGLLIGPLLEADAALRAFLIPAIEEGVKLAPVVVLLWLGRRGMTWTRGATDGLLLGAAAGVGFGLVEDAYIRARFGWPDQIDWLPVTEIIGGQLIVGHGVWTALAGATLGLALLLRGRGSVWLLVAPLGLLVAFLDHFRNNYGNVTSDAVTDVLNLLFADGWTTLWLFVFVVVAAIAADLLVHRRSVGPTAHPWPRPDIAGLRQLSGSWRRLVIRRRLAVAEHHLRELPEARRAEPAAMAERLLAQLRRSNRSASDRDPTPPAAAIGHGSLLLLLFGFVLPMTLPLLVGALFPLLALPLLLDVPSTTGPLTAPGSGGPALGGAGTDADEEEEEEEEEDPCAGQERGVLEARSRVETFDAQLEHYAKQLESLRPEAERLIEEANGLADAAQSELAWHLIEQAFMKVLKAFRGPAGILFDALTNPAGYVGGKVPGSSYAKFFIEMYGIFELVSGDLATLEKFANEKGLDTVKKFVDTMRRLESLAARGAQIGNTMAEIKVERDRWQEELERREQELAACRAAAAS